MTEVERLMLQAGAAFVTLALVLAIYYLASGPRRPKK